MKKNNILILIGLLSLMATCVLAQKSITLEELKRMGKVKKDIKEVKTDTPDKVIIRPRPGMRDMPKEAEVLAKGQNSGVDKPFIYIARTKQDLAVIKGLTGKFSTDKVIDFTKHAVVAAFAGTKNTGGYTLSIYQLVGATHVAVKAPPKDAFVTQVISQPYKVALIDLEEEDSLDLVASEEFQTEMTTYDVTAGEFGFSGGFISIQYKFLPEGTIRLMRSEGLVTFLFALRGKGGESGRKLNEMVSGQSRGGSLNIRRLEAGNFIDRPHPPFDVSVTFDGTGLSMKFVPGKRDYVVNDGYESSGYLEAVRQN